MIPEYSLWLGLAYLAGGLPALLGTAAAGIIAGLVGRRIGEVGAAMMSAAVVFSIFAAPLRTLLEAAWRGEEGEKCPTWQR